MSSSMNTWPGRIARIGGALSLAVLVFALAVVLPAMLGGPTVQSLTDAAGGTGTSGASGSGQSTGASWSGPKDVFVVGDSLTVGTEPWLASDLGQQGWTLDGVDARVGRGVPEGLNILRDQSTPLPDTVVIALGTNNLGATSGDVLGWLRTARSIVGTRRLIWVNLCLADNAGPRLASYHQINAALNEYAADYAVKVADWCGYATRHDIFPGADGIHYAPADYRVRAAFYTATITGSALPASG